MKKGDVLGGIWNTTAEAQLVKYYEDLTVFMYVDDPESEGYWLLTIDDNDNVVLDEWVNGTPNNWVGTTESYGYYGYRRDTVGGFCGGKTRSCQG